MDLFRPTAAAATFLLAAFLTPGQAACDRADHRCEPSADDARQKMQRLLDSAYLTPHTIASFEKVEGRTVKTKTDTVYEMRVLAVVKYLDDKLSCRVRLCPELHNYLVEVDGRAKTAKVAGWVFFKLTSQGWQ